MPKNSRLLNANFILLWQGQFVSLAGTSLSRIALMLWIAEVTESAALMGAIMMVAALPSILLMPLGGAFADRHERKKIIICCDLIHGGLALALAGAIYFGADNQTLAIAAILLARIGMTATDSFFVPAVNALTPDLVPKNKLPAANAFINSTARLAGLAGKLAGGVLYRLLGAPMLLVVDGLTFLISAVSESFIRVSEKRAVGEKAAKNRKEALKGLIADVRIGLNHVWRWKGLRIMVLLSAAIHFFMAPLFVLLPFYVTDPGYLAAPADWYGYILAGYSMGTLTGAWLASLFTEKWRVRRIVLVAGSLGGAGLGIFLMGMFLHPMAALMLASGSGLLFGLSGNIVSSTIQAGVAGEVRGRVLSVTTTLSMCLFPLGLGLAGILAEATRIDLVLAASGLLLALMGLQTFSSRECREFLDLLEEKKEIEPNTADVSEST